MVDVPVTQLSILLGFGLKVNQVIPNLTPVEDRSMFASLKKPNYFSIPVVVVLGTSADD